MKNYRIITKEDYKNNKKNYVNLIRELFKDDNSEIANLKEFIEHLDFIFSDNHKNDSMLILNIEEGKIVSMINFLQYDNIENFWCLFSLFTLKSKRKMGYAEKILKYGIKQIKNKNAKLLISGIKPTNIESIRIHEKVGFRNSGKKWSEFGNGFSDDYIVYFIKLFT